MTWCRLWLAALADARKAVTLAPTFTKATNRCALCYSQLGLFAESAEEYARVVAMCEGQEELVGMATNAARQQEVMEHSAELGKPIDHFAVLGVEPEQCSSAHIKRKYYSLAKRYHPDKGAADDTVFKLLQEVRTTALEECPSSRPVPGLSQRVVAAGVRDADNRGKAPRVRR